MNTPRNGFKNNYEEKMKAPKSANIVNILAEMRTKKSVIN